MKISLLFYLGLCTFVASAFVSDLLIYANSTADQQLYIAWIVSTKYVAIPSLSLIIWLIANKLTGPPRKEHPR